MGVLGAMVFGAVTDERIQFNEDSLWTGEPHDYSHQGAAKYLPQVRQLLFEGKQRQAEQLASEHMMSVPLRQEKYQPFGDLKLHFEGHQNASDYIRQLDLDSAFATVRYTIDGVTYTREVFSSYPDQVIVVRVSCDKPGALNFSATIDSPHKETQTLAISPNTLAMRGQLKPYQAGRNGGNQAQCFEVRVVRHCEKHRWRIGHRR